MVGCSVISKSSGPQANRSLTLVDFIVLRYIAIRMRLTGTMLLLKMQMGMKRRRRMILESR